MRRALIAHALTAFVLIFGSGFEDGDFAGWNVEVEQVEPQACARPWPDPTPWCALSPDPTACDDWACQCQTVCSSEPAGACWFSAQVCL